MRTDERTYSRAKNGEFSSGGGGAGGGSKSPSQHLAEAAAHAKAGKPAAAAKSLKAAKGKSWAERHPIAASALGGALGGALTGGAVGALGGGKTAAEMGVGGAIAGGLLGAGSEALAERLPGGSNLKSNRKKKFSSAWKAGGK